MRIAALILSAAVVLSGHPVPPSSLDVPYGPSIGPDGLTPRQAFDHLLSERPDYRWAEIDGVVVIRPANAWTPGRQRAREPGVGVRDR
jgi:hypothetical protein